MKITKCLWLIAAIIVFLYNSGYAQISKGGLPKSFELKGISQTIPTILMPDVNVDSLLVIDSIESSLGIPFRFGYAFDVNFGLKNSGKWDTLKNGDKLWRLKIQSFDAYSINLILDSFWLPIGAEFFVYNENHSMILGAFTSDVSNNPYNKFATDLVKGEVLVLDYYEPSYASGGMINVDKIIHGYINTFSGNGESGSCNIDVNCPEGNDWCVEKSVVSMILLADNTRWCSGSLLNNVRQDLTPYYLTAFHCADNDGNGVLSQAEINQAQTWVFRFRYQSPTCNQGIEPLSWGSIAGATLRANNHPTDMLLMELTAQPPSGFGVLYAGWDRAASTPQSGVGIHHPRGDVMKISTYNGNVTSVVVGPYNLWELSFTDGVTEPGSSGAPLFNQNRQIVGQLLGTYTANPISCSNPSADVLYGRFDLSWTGGGTPQTRLRDWLDPDNTGTMYVGATSPTIYLINKTLTSTHNFAALEDIHIEGNVLTSGAICPPNNVPFTAESGSTVEVAAKKIIVKRGTHFKAGSNVHLYTINGINCYNNNLVYGDYVDAFCNAQISMKTGGEENEEVKYNEEYFINLSDNLRIFPNPTTGRVTLLLPSTYEEQLNNISISIIDITGRVIQQETAKSINTNFDLSSQHKGNYFVRIQTQDDVIVKKVLLNY